MCLTRKWQMKPSFLDIFIGWKINQTLPPNENMTTFSPSPWSLFHGRFVMLGHLRELAQLTELPRQKWPSPGVTSQDSLKNTLPLSEDSLIWQQVLGALTVKKHSAFFDTHKGTCRAAWPWEPSCTALNTTFPYLSTGSFRKGSHTKGKLRAPLLPQNSLGYYS